MADSKNDFTICTGLVVDARKIQKVLDKKNKADAALIKKLPKAKRDKIGESVDDTIMTNAKKAKDKKVLPSCKSLAGIKDKNLKQAVTDAIIDIVKAYK